MSMFKRAIAMFAAISAAMKLTGTERDQAMGKIGAYRSRGKGRAKVPAPTHNLRAARSRYTPHQSVRECARRVEQMKAAREV